MVKKKTYRKPQIKQVKLVPEEAVLTNCKTTGTGQNRNNDCSNPSQSCMDIGT